MLRSRDLFWVGSGDKLLKSLRLSAQNLVCFISFKSCIVQQNLATLQVYVQNVGFDSGSAAYEHTFILQYYSQSSVAKLQHSEVPEPTPASTKLGRLRRHALGRKERLQAALAPES